MKDFIKNFTAKIRNPITRITEIHSRFEQVHPFEDGNGHTGRLWMHAMALKENLSPVVIRSEQKKLYMTYLNKSQMTGDMNLLEDFVCDALLEGYRIIERE